MEEDNKKPKILIVENDAEPGKNLSDILKTRAYSPLAVLTGKEGIAIAKEEDISLALIDLKLPDISGIEVLKEIKKNSPHTEAIILTAYASLDTAIEAVNLGAFCYLQKPYDMEQVLLCTRRALERKWAEKALRESEERFRAIFEGAEDAIFTKDRKGNYTHVNPACASLFKLHPEGMIGKTDFDLFPPEVAHHIKEKIDRKVLENGAVVSVEDTKPTAGVMRTFHVVKVPLRDANGVIVGLCGIARDITERKQLEENLKESHKFLETVVENIPDSLYIKDSQYRLTLANQAYCDAIGVTKEEIIGKERVRETDKEVFQTGKAIEIPGQHFIDRKGKHHYTYLKKVPLIDESGKITHTLTISRDITERKEVDEAREQLIKELEAKTAEMNRFTYTVSHDLRSPLISIQGFAEMLRKDLEQNEIEKVKSDLKFIENSATKMDRLLTDTLQLSRIGRMVNPPEDVPFGEIVQEALQQAAQQIKLNGVEITVAEDFPAVHVDRMRIAEVLVNLVTNSINYMGEQPRPKIDIGYREDEEETVFFVRDNGIGIDPSQHEKVFELFYQIEKNNKGTGAGLAIVKRIIEVHEGRIWIESEKGKGCAVCFTLPVHTNK